MAAVSFATQIAPLFAPFRDSMTWRLDLTNYEDMSANANLVYSVINAGGMPPSPYAPLSDEQIALFKNWMTQGSPR